MNSVSLIKFSEFVICFFKYLSLLNKDLNIYRNNI